jgi:tRNA pseudouridine55 synthase
MTAAPPVTEGLLLVHKPPGLTSHDVVQVVRHKLGLRRVGHTGTLDPMAEGLLILLAGGATRYQQAFQTHEKLYEAVLRLGLQTDTGDAMGKPLRTAPVPTLDATRVAAVLASFEGPLTQTPPAYSAVKVRGRPAYWWARRQRPVNLEPRVVRLAEIRLINCGPDTVTFRARCSAGTYVRTLAEVIAERLGTVGHLSGLVRLQVGRFRLEDAKPLDWIRQAAPEEVRRQLRPVTAYEARGTQVPSNYGS